MLVIGIDPGSRITGYGIVNSLGGQLEYIGSGCIHTGNGVLSEKLQVIYENVSLLLEQFKPDCMAIEETFLSKNVQSTVKLSEARAVAIVAGANHGLPVYEYTPMQIKQAVVGTGGATKDQVKYMVRMILHLNGTPQTDAADALSCAICHANTIRVTKAMGQEVADASSVRGRLRRS
ncbi:MAG: crossover junction endodeoxyribonuclease RuvC [Succinivibrio sp.]|nr:crossover junction endodeoxyribonuclease RuvC [Succinivibrio sp.]